MRNLTEKEKEYAINRLAQKDDSIKGAMMFFKIFGGIVSGLLLLAIFIEATSNSDRIIGVITIGILYLIFFKGTNLLANKNAETRLLELILQGKASITEVELVDTYIARTGESNKRRKPCAIIKKDGRQFHCDAVKEVLEIPAGNIVGLVTSTTPMINVAGIIIPVENICGGDDHEASM